MRLAPSVMAPGRERDRSRGFMDVKKTHDYDHDFRALPDASRACDTVPD